MESHFGCLNHKPLLPVEQNAGSATALERARKHKTLHSCKKTNPRFRNLSLIGEVLKEMSFPVDLHIATNFLIIWLPPPSGQWVCRRRWFTLKTQASGFSETLLLMCIRTCGHILEYRNFFKPDSPTVYPPACIIKCFDIITLILFH